MTTNLKIPPALAHSAKSARTRRRTRRCSSRSPRRASAPTSCRRSTCLPSIRGLLLAPHHREDAWELPELSEIEIIRHFTRLSTWNYAIDLGMYPLGSCTMKYNPRVNEFVARIEGLAEAHPYRPDSLAQGVLEIIRPAAALPARNHRHGRDHAAAGGRRARRVHRHSAGPRVARVAGQSAQEGSHSRLGARHQSGHGGHLRLHRSRTSSRTPKAASISKPSRGRWTKRPPR
jgi:hypothetical protein